MGGVELDTTLPPGAHAPYAIASEHDHRAYILIATAMGMAVTGLGLLTRVLLRRFVNRGWGLDDTMLTVCTVFAWIQSSLVLVASSDGLGKSVDLIPPHLLARVQKLYYASNIFYIIASDLSRISVVFFIRRVLARNTLELTCTTALLGVIPTFTVAFILATCLQCDLAMPWKIVNEQCTGWFVRWEVHAALSMALELAILAVPLRMVWKLQNKLDMKVGIFTTFALRLIILVFLAPRLASFDRKGFHTDFSLKEAEYISWTQAEMAMSVLAATIPAARKAALELVTYYNANGFTTTNGSRSGSGLRSGSNLRSGRQQGQESYRMKNLAAFGSQGANSAADRNTVTIQAQRDSADNNSQEAIIKKQVTVEIDRQTGQSPYQYREQY